MVIILTPELAIFFFELYELRNIFNYVNILNEFLQVHCYTPPPSYITFPLLHRKPHKHLQIHQILNERQVLRITDEMFSELKNTFTISLHISFLFLLIRNSPRTVLFVFLFLFHSISVILIYISLLYRLFY